MTVDDLLRILCRYPSDKEIRISGPAPKNWSQKIVEVSTINGIVVIKVED